MSCHIMPRITELKALTLFLKGNAGVSFKLVNGSGSLLRRTVIFHPFHKKLFLLFIHGAS